MIAIIAGMRRSGSTYSFNVARELLAARGGVSCVNTRSLEEALSASEGPRHLLVKTHAPDELTTRLLSRQGLPCICTIRKPEDAIASWMSTFGFSLEDSVSACREWLEWHRPRAHLVMNVDYDDIETKPLIVVGRIGRYLVRDMRLAEAARIWWRYRKSAVYRMTQSLEKETSNVTDIGFSFYDKHTFFHRRHVSRLTRTSALEVLSRQQIDYVRHQLNEYVDVAGNYVWQ